MYIYTYYVHEICCKDTQDQEESAFFLTLLNSRTEQSRILFLAFIFRSISTFQIKYKKNILNHILNFNTYNGTITIIFVRQHDYIMITSSLLIIVHLQSIRSMIDWYFSNMHYVEYLNDIEAITALVAWADFMNEVSKRPSSSYFRN